MIGYLRGEITAIFPDFCFLETGGVGYRVFISGKDRELLHVGQDAKLLTYMAVREDAIGLYGFLSKEAYDLFLILISISKIGPKVAMGILSSLSPSSFIMAIRTKNMAVLTKLPGIGKKTAERLVVELKDKVGNAEEISVNVDSLPEETSVIYIAAGYLRALGYEDNEFLPVLQKLSKTCDTASHLVQGVLREFGTRK